MGRIKGSLNKAKAQTLYQLNEEERLSLIAHLIIDILSEEEKNATTSEAQCTDN